MQVAPSMKKNNLKLHKIIIFKFMIIFLLIFSVDIAYAEINPTDEDYLWLDFVGNDKYPGDCGTQHLIIRYGKFPNFKKDVSALSEIEAFCTFGKKDKSGNDIFYKLDIESKNGSYFISVGYPSETWCMVLVKGRKTYNGLEYRYVARAPFFIFGRKTALYKAKRTKVSGKIYDAFDITIYRERVKEELTYNRKRLFPIRGTVKFTGKPWGKEIANIINDRSESISIQTDKNGDFVYFPRYFKGSRPKGITSYGEDLLVLRSSLGNTSYAATYTILFDSLPMQERHINLALGLSLFLPSFVITWIYLWLRNRSITHETP